MTVNKAQGIVTQHLTSISILFWGQTLKRVGLYLKNNVFSHGQLYVAFSRVSDPKDITVFLDEEEGQHGWVNDSAYTKNVVFSSIVDDEVRKFKKSEDYGEGPFEFTDGKSFQRLTFFKFCVWDCGDLPPNFDFSFHDSDDCFDDSYFQNDLDYVDIENESESYSENIPPDFEPDYGPPISSDELGPDYWKPIEYDWSDDEKQGEEEEEN